MPTTKVPASRMIDHNIGSYCFRNKIINGDMRIDQRNAGSSVTVTNSVATYTLDRWLIYCNGSNITSQRVSGNSFGTPYPYAAIRLTGATSNTNANINQRIEAASCYDLAGQNVTVSFKVVSNTTLTNCYIGGYTAVATDLWNGTEVSYSPGTKIFTSTTTPTTITHTFVMPSVLNGYELIVGVSGLLAGQTIDITNVQLEVGPTATPFEYRPIGTELALCQRYYFSQRITGIGMRLAAEANGTVVVPFNFPVPMRAVPSGADYPQNDGTIDGDTGNLNFPFSTIQALVPSRVSSTQAQAQLGVQSGVGTTYGYPYRVIFRARVDAEL